MNDNLAKQQADSTGGGRLGRLILLADLSTLSPALLHLCVRDLIASMISINEASIMLRSLFTPQAVSQLAQAPGGDVIVKLIKTVEFNHNLFERYGDTVKLVISQSGQNSEQVDPQVADVTRMWAFSAMLLRDSVTELKQRLRIVVEPAVDEDLSVEKPQS